MMSQSRREPHSKKQLSRRIRIAPVEAAVVAVIAAIIHVRVVFGIVLRRVEQAGALRAAARAGAARDVIEAGLTGKIAARRAAAQWRTISAAALQRVECAAERTGRMSAHRGTDAAHQE